MFVEDNHLPYSLWAREYFSIVFNIERFELAVNTTYDQYVCSQVESSE
jgi:hypothetical protein